MMRISPGQQEIKTHDLRILIVFNLAINIKLRNVKCFLSIRRQLQTVPYKQTSQYIMSKLNFAGTTEITKITAK